MDFFFNTPDTVVDDTLAGLARIAPIRLSARESSFRIAIDHDWPGETDRVAVISGGGSGHEPSHAGFVGHGMLTAAVAGDLFTSPSVEAVLAAIRATAGAAGVLLIVKNYTGDRLNFGLAAERARGEGIDVETVIVADDISLPEAVAARGLAGTVLVHKIAGAAAAEGAPLGTVAERAREAADAMVSIGLALSSATLPGTDREPRSPELGLGIHNEPGVKHVEPGDVRDAISLALEPLVAAAGARMTRDTPVALLLNNMGGCSTQEMHVLLGETIDQLAGLGWSVEQAVVPAALMSSMNMHGFSITLLALDDVRRAGLAASVKAIAWPGMRPVRTIETLDLGHETSEAAEPTGAIDDRITRLLASVCDAVIADRCRLDDLDAATGDGDTGTAFARGANAIREALDDQRLSTGEPARLAREIGDLLAREMGGSSGVLLSILANATGNALAGHDTLAAALGEGMARMQHHGGAAPGDRTMLDALAPAITALADTDDWAAAARAAQAGAEATADIERAGAGRAAYVPSDALAGHVDPGAAAMATIIDAVANAV